MSERRKTIIQHILFALAEVSIIGGAGLLMVTTNHVSGPRVLWPLLVVMVALILAYFTIIGRRTMRSIFIWFFLALTALIHFVAVVYGMSTVDYWPLYAVAAGVCALLAGFIRYKRVRPNFIVPAVALMLLGSFFSIFSFGFSSMRFKTFLSRWWPALFIAAGFVLLILWFVQRIVLGKVKDKPLEKSQENSRAASTPEPSVERSDQGGA